MTSRGRKALSVTCGDSSPPKGEPRHRILAQEMERICIDTLHSLLQLPLNARAARKSDGRKTVSVQHPLPPCGRGGPAAARTEEGQITATSIGKCWHLRRQMTSRGRKALSVTCGDSSPKGRAKASYIGTRNGAYLYRYAPFTVLQLPSMRVPPESRMVVNGFRPRTPCLSLWEVASCEDGEGQITATSIGKCWHLRRQMTSRGRKALSVTCGDSSPKGEPRHRILAQEMERICIDTLHSLFYGYPSMRVPPESRMVVKRFPSRPLPLLWERWPAQRGRKRANNGNVNRKNAGTFAGR